MIEWTIVEDAGACCYLRLDGVVKKCPYMIKLSNGKTYCKIYKNRLGHKTAKINGVQFVCMNRSDLHLNFVGCPYNRPEWGDVLRVCHNKNSLPHIMNMSSSKDGHESSEDHL